MAEFKSILIPTDFSPCSEYAVRYAAALALGLGAEVHLAHVIDMGYMAYAAMYGQTGVVDPDIASVEEACAESLEKQAQALKGKGLDVTVHLEKGAPSDVLPKLAAAKGCDLIVVGTHGHSGFDRFLFGSTCERLVRRSSIPVLAVKQTGPDVTLSVETLTIDRILNTTDLSDWSRTALPYAAGLCPVLTVRPD